MNTEEEIKVNLQLIAMHAAVQGLQAEAEDMRLRLENAERLQCQCICHQFPEHGKLQDALEALVWHQQQLENVTKERNNFWKFYTDDHKQLDMFIKERDAAIAANKAEFEGHKLTARSLAKAVWQPIETAPEDGTVVIGFDPTRDDDDGLPHGVDFMRWWNGCWIDPLTHSLRPTLWMKLPDPPKDPVLEKVKEPEAQRVSKHSRIFTGADGKSFLGKE